MNKKFLFLFLLFAIFIYFSLPCFSYCDVGMSIQAHSACLQRENYNNQMMQMQKQQLEMQRQQMEQQRQMMMQQQQYQQQMLQMQRQAQQYNNYQY